LHFLITNDDGINAVGIKALADAVARRGHTAVVCAPATQQSAVGAHLSLFHPLICHDQHRQDMPSYAVEGTPVDCVRVAPHLTDKPYDFCFSGINDGFNAGCAVFYSGTVNAAREATMMHIRSMAVSIEAKADPKALEAAADLAVSLAEKLEKVELPRLCVMSLNVPKLPPEQWKELRTAPLSQAYFLDTYEKRTNPFGRTYFWMNAGLNMEEHAPDSDVKLLSEGHPTFTFIGGLSDFNAELGKFLHENAK